MCYGVRTHVYYEVRTHVYYVVRTYVCHGVTAHVCCGIRTHMYCGVRRLSTSKSLADTPASSVVGGWGAGGLKAVSQGCFLKTGLEGGSEQSSIPGLANNGPRPQPALLTCTKGRGVSHSSAGSQLVRTEVQKLHGRQGWNIPHFPALHRPGTLNINSQKLPSSFLPQTKRNLVCL